MNTHMCREGEAFRFDTLLENKNMIKRSTCMSRPELIHEPT